MTKKFRYFFILILTDGGEQTLIACSIIFSPCLGVGKSLCILSFFWVIWWLWEMSGNPSLLFFYRRETMSSLIKVNMVPLCATFDIMWKPLRTELINSCNRQLLFFDHHMPLLTVLNRDTRNREFDLSDSEMVN